MPEPKPRPNPQPKPQPKPQTRRDLVELLRELEAERDAQGMPLGARNRVQLEIRQHESRRRAAWRRMVPLASFAAGAALVLAVVGSHWAPASQRSQPSSLAPLVALGPTPVGFRVLGDACGPAANALPDTAVELSARCRLVAPHASVEVWEPSTVRMHGRDLTVEAGSVLVEVQPVSAGDEPVRVEVSHGTIEVIGTRFAIEQRAEGGHVDLLEGTIRFHGPGGRVVDVLPGERHSWGARDEPTLEDAVVSSAAAELPQDAAGSAPPRRSSPPRTRRSKEPSASAIIERVTELRAQRRYGAAVTELRRALRRSWDSRTAQVLSYELGELLRATEDTLGACEHFADHQRTYPDGRYATAVDAVLGRLDCE